MTTSEKVRAAVQSLGCFKPPGTDGIYPSMLKEDIQHLERLLPKIFLAWLDVDYVSTFWQKVKVVLTPKLGKGDYSNSKKANSR